MYARIGNVGNTERNAIWWRGKSIDGKHTPFEMSKIKAQEFIGKQEAYKMLSRAEYGIAVKESTFPFIDALGLHTQEKLDAFLELYGYWLGDGSLMFKAYGGRDAVHFSIVKPHDVEWLMNTFSDLELVKDKDFTCGNGPCGISKEHKIYLTNENYIEFFLTEYRHKYVSGNPNLVRPTTVEGRKLGSRTLIAENTTDVSSHEEHDNVKSAKWFMTWVWNVDKNSIRKILRGLRRADGSESDNGSVIYTSSVRFRDEIVRACIHGGYAPRFQATYLAGAERGLSRSGTPIIAKHTNWRVTYADSGLYAEPVLRSATDIKEVSYEGRTWCVSVPSTYIVARRAHLDNGVVTKASVPVVVGNCMVAHGTSEFLKEIMMEKSDNFQCNVCKSCGLIGLVNPRMGIFKCSSCSATTNFSQVRVPYAYKLFLQELESMNISSRLLPESRLREIGTELSQITAGAKRGIA
jgi:ribosomal protein L37AE/L43A